MNLAIPYILAVMTVASADQCENMDGKPMQLKGDTDLATSYCSGAVATATGKVCTDCCTVMAGTCYAVYSGAGTPSCGDGKTEDALKIAVKATKTDYATKCCSAYATCTGKVCDAGFKLKANPGTVKCFGPAAADCDNGGCCDADPLTCGGGNAGAITASKGCDAATQVADQTKLATTVAADFSDFKTKCCVTKPAVAASVCTAATTCNAGTEKVSPAPNTQTVAFCCKAKADTCAGTTGKTCPNTHFKDTAKAAATVGADNFNTVCCTLRATCTAFKTTVSTSTSSANNQQSQAMLVLLAGGALALGM